MIIDIRKVKEVTGIKFDDSSDVIYMDDGCFCIGDRTEIGKGTSLCDISDVDLFISALKKAKEIWE